MPMPRPWARLHGAPDAARQQVVFVTVGTGIGVGIVLRGELYRGVDGAHPEIGHQIVDAGGPQCYCGARGCWEALAAGPAMARWMDEQTPWLRPERETNLRHGRGG